MRFERLDPEDGVPAPCSYQGLWCSGLARWLLGNQRLCSSCKRVVEEAQPDRQPGDPDDHEELL